MENKYKWLDIYFDFRLFGCILFIPLFNIIFLFFHIHIIVVIIIVLYLDLMPGPDALLVGFLGRRSKIPLISILIYSCFNCDARSLRRKWNISVGPVYLCGWPDAALFSVLHRYTSELRFLPAQPWVAESNDQQQQNNIEHLFIHFSINRSPNIWCFCLYYWPCCTSALLNQTYRSMHFTVVTTILLPARWAVL